MLFKLGLKNLRHNIFINILIVIQMTVVFLITISMISTIISRFQFYSPIEKYLNSKGFFYCFDNAINPDTQQTLRSTDELYELIEGERNIVASYNDWLTYKGDNSKFISYDDEFINMFTPELEAGQWFDLSKDQSDIVQVVVSENPYGFKVGDRITLDSFGNDMDAEIIGILKKNTKVIGFSKPTNGKYDCRNAFMNYNYEIEEVPLFILSQRGLVDKNVTMQLSGLVFVTYSKDISDEILESNNNTMKKMMTLNITPLNEMKANSMNYIFSQIYTLFPILICILILTLISAVSISALSAKNQLKNYAVYYICGLKWKQCVMINFYSSLVSVIFSFIMSIIPIFVMKLTGAGETVIDFGIWQFISCVLIMLLYIILSLILPISIIGKNTPNQILKSNG